MTKKKTKPAAKKRAAKKKAAPSRDQQRRIMHMQIDSLALRVVALANTVALVDGLAGQVGAALVKVDAQQALALSDRARVDDIALTLGVLKVAIERLSIDAQRVDRIREAVKQHEEQYHLPIDKDDAIDTRTVHILLAGQTLCGLAGADPWPEGEVWVSAHERPGDATCPACIEQWNGKEHPKAADDTFTAVDEMHRALDRDSDQ